MESVYAQTKATNSNNNTTTTGVGSASNLENITRGNTSLSQNRGDIANPTIGLAGGLEKEQINDTEGNMTASDKTVGLLPYTSLITIQDSIELTMRYKLLGKSGLRVSDYVLVL